MNILISFVFEFFCIDRSAIRSTTATLTCGLRSKAIDSCNWNGVILHVTSGCSSDSYPDYLVS